MASSRESIRILHVDDEPDQVELAARFLEREDDRFEVIPETSTDRAAERVHENDLDCIVSDYEMPGRDGLEFLNVVRETEPDVPFILFTGKGSEEIASTAISAGVTDYLRKGGPEVYCVLANRIANAVAQYRARQELVRFKRAVEYAGHAIYMTDADGRIIYVNPVFEEVTGYTEEEAVGETPTILNSGEHGDEYFRRLWNTISNGEVWSEQVINRRNNGERYTARQTIAPIQNGANGIDGYVAVQQDVSEY